MFPLRDDNPTEITPFVTMAFIAACVGVWVLVQGAGMDGSTLEASVCSFGAIPAELTGEPVRGPCASGGLVWGAVVTSMFLHGSWMHLVGNMWFLWIFGNNVEDSMGHLRFVAFYILTGLAAAGAHVLSEPSSPIPVVGASGAISGIMGAYLVLYPRARVLTAVVLIFFIRLVPLPAFVMLGLWFLLQLLSAQADPGGGGGVAFWAHVGGFVAGVALVIPLRRKDLVEAKRAHVKLPRDRIANRGWW